TLYEWHLFEGGRQPSCIRSVPTPLPPPRSLTMKMVVDGAPTATLPDGQGPDSDHNKSQSRRFRHQGCRIRRRTETEPAAWGGCQSQNTIGLRQQERAVVWICDREVAARSAFGDGRQRVGRQVQLQQRARMGIHEEIPGKDAGAKGNPIRGAGD